MNICPKCKKEKELTNNGYCRECVTEYNRKYMKNKGRKSFQDWRNTKSGKEKTKEINRRAYLKRTGQLKEKVKPEINIKQKQKLKVNSNKLDPVIQQSKTSLKKQIVNDLNTFSSKSEKKLSLQEIGNKNDIVSNLLDYFIQQQEKINKVDESCYDNKWRIENYDIAKPLLEKSNIEHWKKVIDVLLKNEWWSKNRSRTMKNVSDFEQEYYKTVNDKKSNGDKQLDKIDFIENLKQEILVRKKHSSLKYTGLKENPELDKYFSNGKLKKEYVEKYNLQRLV